MFEKFTDFDGKQFLNLWGGFSCECFVDGINTFVMFYIKDEEVLSLSGNEANDVLDFVLSEYYENEDSTIEDGFSTWLMGHYDNVMPTFDGVEPKFHEGEWLCVNKPNDYAHLVKIIKVVDVFGKERYKVSRDYDSDLDVVECDFIEKNYHLWTISDAKDGDILANDHHILILKELVYDWSSNGTSYSVKAYCGIKPNGNFEIGKDNWSFCGTLHLQPATKEQRDTLFAKMKEAGYEWDYKEKELEKIDRQNTVNFNKEAEVEETLTTDDIPLSVLYKTLLKDNKRQDRIIEKQKKEIKKLKDKIYKYSIKNYKMRKQLERYGVTV